MSEPAFPISVSAAARAADTLREHIIEGRYRSGEPLREITLARSLGVSRNTVRESFRMLAEDGLVEHAPNRGVTVRGLTATDIEDIYRIRRALELLGLESVAADPSALSDVVTSAEEAAEAGDWPAVSTSDLRFHQTVVAALGSPRLDAMFQRLLAELRLAFADMPDLREFHEPYLRRNRELVELLRAGKIPAARKELTSYLEAAEQQILGMLRHLDR